jgi:hypothetical protein
MTKEERFMNRVENVENTLLRSQAKVLNDLGLTDKIKLVAVKKIDLANAFTLTVEKIAAEHDEDTLPDSCSDLYNNLHTDEESPLDVAPEKKAKPKPKLVKKGDAKKTGAKKTGPPQKPVDEYGTREGTLAHTFVQEVKKKPQTMAEVRKAEWNPRGYHFDGTLARLVAEKKATVEDDIINIV